MIFDFDSFFLLAKFLFSIGLQRVVPLSKLLEIAAGTDSVKRTIALDYLLSEWTENSYGTQLATLKNIPAFVPAIRNKQAILLRPNEVFESSGSSCLGFAIIDPRYSEHATKLQCSSHPPASDLARALLAQGENSIAISKSQFAYLSTQVSGELSLACVLSILWYLLTDFDHRILFLFSLDTQGIENHSYSRSYHQQSLARPT